MDAFVTKPIELAKLASLLEHWHATAELFYVLEGTLAITLDAETITAPPATFVVIPSGVVHSFSNPASTPVRWLETQAPQPPPRHSYRFARDWDYLKSRISQKAP